MKNLHNALIIAVLVLGAWIAGGCAALYPMPKLINVSATQDFIIYPDITVTILNEGAEGTILVTAKQGAKTHKKIFFFKKNEQKQITLNCTSFGAGAYTVEAKATELSSEEEMRGASS